jgi:hypothetical protein
VKNHSFNVRGLLLILLLFFLYSCQKEEQEAAVLLTPYQLIISNVHPEEVVSLLIECKSSEELKQFTITSRVEGNLSKTELDTVISGKNFYFRFEYVVPALIESKQILLEFIMRDILGKATSNAKILDVITTVKYLEETAGHELFSGNSGKQNAYNLLTGLPLFSHLADSSVMHIADTSDSHLLLKRWISPAGVKFVRFSGFDYANSTTLSIKNAYGSGIKMEFIDNLNAGDILLIGITNKDKTESYAAVKIVNIIDETESVWDRYIFNIKK